MINSVTDHGRRRVSSSARLLALWNVHGMEEIMKKQWMFFVAAMAAFGITACGSGDGIVINGTTAMEAGSDQGESTESAAQAAGSGTKIEIITGETSSAEETAAPPEESYSQPASQPETTAYVPETAATAASTAAASSASAGAAVPETTAARTYKVTDTKKTMYATASVRVRASYSTSSDVLAALAEGEKVEVTGESENGWMRVSYKGNVGYVSKSYLTEKAPQTTSQTSAGQNTGGTGSSGKGNASGTGSSNSSNTSTAGGSSQGTAPGSGTAAGTTTGTTTGTAGGNAAGPSAGAGSTTSGGKTGPGAGGNSENSPAAGSTTGPGGNSGSAPGAGNTPGGAASAPGSGSSGGNSVTGSVTALNPSGVTIQTSDGTSYQFVWGDNTPDLEPGEKIQIYYETTGSGERRVTNYSK